MDLTSGVFTTLYNGEKVAAKELVVADFDIVRKEFGVLNEMREIYPENRLVNYITMLKPGPGRMMLVMEYLDGQTLDKVDPLENAFWPLAMQLAETVAQLHRVGVAHRNIKPANVMLLGNWRRLVDMRLLELSHSCGPRGYCPTLGQSDPHGRPPHRICPNEYFPDDMYSLGRTLESVGGLTPGSKALVDKLTAPIPLRLNADQMVRYLENRAFLE